MLICSIAIHLIRRPDAAKEAENTEESRPQRKKAWKKSSEKKVKITYKTADEIMSEASAFPAVQPMKIIDMTGPQVTFVHITMSLFQRFLLLMFAFSSRLENYLQLAKLVPDRKRLSRVFPNCGII